MQSSRRWAIGGGVVCFLAVSCGGGDEGGESGERGGQFVRLDDAPENVGVATLPAESSAPEVAPSAPVPEAESAAPPAPVAEAAAPEVVQPETNVDPYQAREAAARQALDSGAAAAAAKQYGALLLDGLSASPEAPRDRLRTWSEALTRAQAAHRWSRRGVWPSIEITVQPGDSLIAIRQRALAANPGLLLSTGLIAKANELPSETAIRPGDTLRIPTDRASALVDISGMWTLFLLGDEVAASWEVGVGKAQTPTRPGAYTVGLKQKEPMWSPVGRAPVPYGDPENPLGTRWLAWFDQGRNTSLGFHGTNDPSGVGRAASDGCVRMRNADVELLFEILPRDARVLVRP